MWLWPVCQVLRTSLGLSGCELLWPRLPTYTIFSKPRSLWLTDCDRDLEFNPNCQPGLKKLTKFDIYNIFPAVVVYLYCIWQSVMNADWPIFWTSRKSLHAQWLVLLFKSGSESNIIHLFSQTYAKVNERSLRPVPWTWSIMVRIKELSYVSTWILILIFRRILPYNSDD